jgi:hypothetical protein
LIANATFKSIVQKIEIHFKIWQGIICLSCQSLRLILVWVSNTVSADVRWCNQLTWALLLC